MIQIAPSVLSADFGRFGEEVRAVDAGGADWIHLDVMDGHFVPNLTIGPAVVAAVRKVTRLTLDTHLMVDHSAARVAKAGAEVLVCGSGIFATPDYRQTIAVMRRAAEHAAVAAA